MNKTLIPCMIAFTPKAIEKCDFPLWKAFHNGKTHMMTALGILACNNDYRVKFYTVSQLVILLKKAKEENNLDKIYKILEKQDLLCLDEFGYIPMDLEGAQLLF